MTDPLTQFLTEMSRPEICDALSCDPDTTAAVVVEYLQAKGDQNNHESIAYASLADAIECLDHCGGTHRKLAEVLAYGVLAHKAKLTASFWNRLATWTYLRQSKLRRAIRAMRRES